LGALNKIFRFFFGFYYLYPLNYHDLSGLTIYKASAGSGKTFAITKEYIHLLFRDAENYKYILGVTFTNKATAEMKGRIIAELDKLARGEASGYAADIMKIYALTPAVLKQRASLILSKILHDYSRFSILTIDSFFQRIIRAFAREVGYYQGFDVEIDQHRILTAAVDQMIFELESNAALRDWLVRFAEDKIVEGSSWNVNRDIERIGAEIFKETFKEFGDKLIEKITDKKFLDQFGKRLEMIKTGFENSFRQLGANAVEIIGTYGLTAGDFKGKSRSVCNFFEKHAQYERFDKYELKDTIRNHLNDLEKWLGSDKAKNLLVEKAYYEGLNRLLGEIIEMYDSQFIVYRSAVEVQKYLYVLGVLADLLLHIREYTSGRNLFMISDTGQFLHKLIQGSDAPFIYERTGISIHHFMIDEFQDTSALQWQNFKPLIINSLAENNENWVVGDVKQSIYRWRNSDWTILSEKIFADLAPHELNVKTLYYNWRSSRNIIRFNNSFFRNAIDVLLAEVAGSQDGEPVAGMDDFEHLLTNAYSDFAQLVPDNRNDEPGYVKVEFLAASEDKEVKFEDQALQRLAKIIELLQDHHYDLKDIAILVRTREEGNMVSNYLLKYKEQQAVEEKYRYDVLSGDSLLLKNSEVVKWLIGAFTYILEPDDELNRAFLIYEYEYYIFSARQAILRNGQEEEVEKQGFHQTFSSAMPQQLETFFRQEVLRKYPVYELCDVIIGYFGLSAIKSELPFIQAFQDMLQEYTRKESADLHAFLAWWDENQDKRVISMPDGQDAIRLMTLHTAKGLEFKVVIMPFGDWPFMKAGWNSNILWCSTDIEPFNSLELLPVSLTKGLQKTIFSRDYFRERALSYVDNLNLLYVAFTRAIDALYVIVPEPVKDSVENNMGNLIAQTIKHPGFEPSEVQYPAFRLTDYWNEAEKKLEYGDLQYAGEKAGTGNYILLGDNAYIIRPVSQVVKQVIPANDLLVTSGGVLTSRINTGKIMHEVFQRIKTIEDVDKALSILNLEGKVRDADMEPLSVRIKALLQDKKVCAWFSPGWEVRTEAGILLQNGSIPRPDRVLIRAGKAVVIDYKFGETEHPVHQKQVRGYMLFLHDLGYKETEGYLWYVNLDKVVPVVLVPEQGKLF
jgi:ATP-dependent helicase/nuclease subunit A